MSSYRILEHTADMKISVAGGTLPGLFNNALLAMTEIMKPIPAKVIRKATRPISLVAKNATVLLVDFLNQALLYSHIYKEAYTSCSFIKISPNSLEGELRGYGCKGFREDVKAVTYHDAKVTRDKNEWRTNIIFDI